MLSPTTGWLRVLRAASLGIAGFVLALVGHVAAGGSAPGLAVLVLLAWLIGLAAVLLTRVRLSAVRVGLSLTSIQVVLHEAFMRLSAPVDCLMTGASAATGHPGHGGPGVLDCATTVTQEGMGQRSVLATATMVVAHVAATAVLAALLAYGEKVLWFLAGCMPAPRWLRIRLPEIPVVVVVSPRAPRMLRVRSAYGGVGLRGPPPQGLLAII
jgi:hypothetical protein